MNNEPLTLKHCLTDNADQPIAGAIDLGALLPSVTAAAAALPDAATSQLVETFKTALDGLFAIGLGDVLATSWSKVSALGDALEATRKTPGTTALVPLLDHKVTSAHKPHIDLAYGGKTLVTIPFDVALSISLKGVLLEIRDGAIVNVKGGSLIGDGALSFGGKKVLQHTTRELSLPGRLAFAGSKETAAAPDLRNSR
jgi:hypothetical protein